MRSHAVDARRTGRSCALSEQRVGGLWHLLPTGGRGLHHGGAYRLREQRSTLRSCRAARRWGKNCLRGQQRSACRDTLETGREELVAGHAWTWASVTPADQQTNREIRLLEKQP
jgi:hypothetical protein